VEAGGGWLAACDGRRRHLWQDFLGHDFRISAGPYLLPGAEWVAWLDEKNQEKIR
jgi:hypothetical protein